MLKEALEQESTNNEEVLKYKLHGVNVNATAKEEKFVNDLFDSLPISAIIDGQFICLHGGLSPDIKTVEDLQKLNRFIEPPTEGAYCDILWSDPIDNASGEIKE